MPVLKSVLIDNTSLKFKLCPIRIDIWADRFLTKAQEKIRHCESLAYPSMLHRFLGLSKDVEKTWHLSPSR